MSLFTIDREKCKHDFLCVADCPAKIIEVVDKDAPPQPIAGAEELCINCGHCVAVCPHAALSLKTMKPEDCPPARRDFLPGLEQVEHFFRYRRSTRNYKDEPVEREKLSRLIDIARYAPSGHNLQPVHWLVIQDSKEVRRLAGIVIDWMRWMMREQPVIAAQWHFERVVEASELGLDRVLRGAPHLVVAHGEASLPPAQVASIIALSYMELAALALGLGACWAGYFTTCANNYPPMKEALALPRGHTTFGGMMVGYPKLKYQRLPLRNEPRVTWR